MQASLQYLWTLDSEVTWVHPFSQYLGSKGKLPIRLRWFSTSWKCRAYIVHYKALRHCSIFEPIPRIQPLEETSCFFFHCCQITSTLQLLNLVARAIIQGQYFEECRICDCEGQDKSLTAKRNVQLHIFFLELLEELLCNWKDRTDPGNIVSLSNVPYFQNNYSSISPSCILIRISDAYVVQKT